MVEARHLQGDRIEDGQDQANHDLPAHEAGDRLVDLTPEGPISSRRPAGTQPSTVAVICFQSARR